MGKDVFHVTPEENVDSIQEQGLQPSPSINDRGKYVFVTPTKEDAKDVEDAYFASSEETATFRASVPEYKLMDDPDPHGDLESLAFNGEIKPDFLERIE